MYSLSWQLSGKLFLQLLDLLLVLVSLYVDPFQDVSEPLEVDVVVEEGQLRRESQGQVKVKRVVRECFIIDSC